MNVSLGTHADNTRDHLYINIIVAE